MREFFQNSTELILRGSTDWEQKLRAELDHFPVISDFSIVLEPTGSESSLFDGPFFRMVWTSVAFGELLVIPHRSVVRELKRCFDTNVAIGSLRMPYQFCEQGYDLYLFCDNGFLYCLIGDEPAEEAFATWFRVPLEAYVRSWKALIAHFGPEFVFHWPS